MRIVVMGAGAIGSLFGALLCKKNKVFLIARRPHVKAIRERGLLVRGKTKLKVRVPAFENVNDIGFSPDLLILTVKSYDTETSMREACKIINRETIVLSLQNGLDNIEKIERIVASDQIIAGVTTNGALFSAPGSIIHTGKGKTILGELNKRVSKRLQNIVSTFNESGIETGISKDIFKEIWIKAIINSCINPLTAFFECKNGYLLQNPLLEKIVEMVCNESTSVAIANGIELSHEVMIEKTREVIRRTCDNYSSMLQSIRRGKRTEIDSINGKLVEIGERCNLDTPLNKILTSLIKYR
jgi:2-dehydropantoate 2-reductase